VSEISRLTEPLKRALRLLELGLSVIPVPRPRLGAHPGEPGDGKVPTIAWREYQTRVPSADEVKDWFVGAPMNIAVITGSVSGVVVLDADAADALRWCTTHLPYTPWQTETAKGFHLWYRHPGVRVANRTRLETRDGRLAVDIRGDGGYVVAPGSMHASGVEYREAGDWSVSHDDVPRFWPGWLQGPRAPIAPATSAERPTGNVVARARRYLAAIPPPVIGQGSDSATLYAACRLVRGFALSPADAEALLWEWAGNRPSWTHEWIARKVAHAERYGTEPIGALR
jgi:bifunctional DNA primase/polymerase-like protein